MQSLGGIVGDWRLSSVAAMPGTRIQPRLQALPVLVAFGVECWREARPKNMTRQDVAGIVPYTCIIPTTILNKHRLPKDYARRMTALGPYLPAGDLLDCSNDDNQSVQFSQGDAG